MTESKILKTVTFADVCKKIHTYLKEISEIVDNFTSKVDTSNNTEYDKEKFFIYLLKAKSFLQLALTSSTLHSCSDNDSDVTVDAEPVEDAREDIVLYQPTVNNKDDSFYCNDFCNLITTQNNCGDNSISDVNFSDINFDSDEFSNDAISMKSKEFLKDEPEIKENVELYEKSSAHVYTYTIYHLFHLL